MSLSQSQSFSADDSLYCSLPRCPNAYYSNYPPKGFNSPLSYRLRRENVPRDVRNEHPFREDKPILHYPSEYSRGGMDLMVSERRDGVPSVASGKGIECRCERRETASSTNTK